MRIGNPDRPTKHEREAGDFIYKIERMLVDYLRTIGAFPGPGIKIDPELYYDNENQPSRFLEMSLGPSASIRVALERRKTGTKWTCYWTIFSKGQNIEEGYFQGNDIPQLKPLLIGAIGRYQYLLEAHYR